MKYIVREAEKYVYGLPRRTSHTVPGWNSHVKVLHVESWRAFCIGDKMVLPEIGYFQTVCVGKDKFLRLL